MPRRFRNFLKKKRTSKRSTSRRDYDSENGLEEYEYGISDYHNANRSKPNMRKQYAKQPSGRRWSFNHKKKNAVPIHRSSRSLGSAGHNGRLLNDSDSLSNDTEDGDFFSDMNHIERKFSAVGEENDDDDDDEEESTQGLQELDRACVRLDGIEVYAIVSALTCATAISCFDNYDPTPLSVIVKERAIFTLLSELFYYASGAWGMMTGLHCTLIFSLVTMYGRTAVGIDRDDAFNEFFSNTSPERFNGFKSFKQSLYCFMTQLSFLIGKKFFFAPIRPFVLIFTGYYSYINIFVDSENILKAADVIFSNPAPPPPPPPAEIHEEDSFDRRSSMERMKKRASVAKRGYSLSTRNFGVDTSETRRGSLFTSTPNFGTSSSFGSSHLAPKIEEE